MELDPGIHGAYRIAIETERDFTEGFSRGFVILRSDLELMQEAARAIGRSYQTTYEIVEADLRDQVRDHEGRELTEHEVRVVVRGEGPRPRFVIDFCQELLRDRLNLIAADGCDIETVNTVLLKQLQRIGRSSR